MCPATKPPIDLKTFLPTEIKNGLKGQPPFATPSPHEIQSSKRTVQSATLLWSLQSQTQLSPKGHMQGWAPWPYCLGKFFSLANSYCEDVHISLPSTMVSHESRMCSSWPNRIKGHRVLQSDPVITKSHDYEIRVAMKYFCVPGELP